uniref:Chromate transporter n=1 Tax=Spongospora subterranea TaxID=70186 RepID=A0A0H5QGK9_9EUKA|eukprot:CRZ00737.1 hypothetical protein [Spongospora subterranea]
MSSVGMMEAAMTETRFEVNNNHDPGPGPTTSFKGLLYETIWAYAPLPWITFGGPQAHVAVLFNEFVVKRSWISEGVFAELLAISAALPGPASTQLAFSIALIHAGVLCALLSFFIWSLPGAIIMTAFGYVVTRVDMGALPPSALFIHNSLTAVAIALVASAAYKLGGKLLVDRTCMILACSAGVAIINLPGVPYMIPSLMMAAGAITVLEGLLAGRRWPINAASDPLLGPEPGSEQTRVASFGLLPNSAISYSPGTGSVLVLTAILLALVPLAFPNHHSLYLHVFTKFYLVGLIIFGGGPVVIPLLFNYTVSNGWLSDHEFLLGLTLINALPGPNFNFACYCGALVSRGSILSSITGGVLAWIAIFTPGLLVKAGVLPIWQQHRNMVMAKTLFKGFNSAAVGLVFGAIYLLWKEAVVGGQSGQSLEMYPILVSTSAVSFVAIEFLTFPVLAVIVLGGVAGYVQFLLNFT